MNKKQHRIAAGLTAMALAVLNSGCSQNQESMEERYHAGYEQGYADGLAYSEKLSSEMPQTIDVTVEGDFTATVRALIPDYVRDSETPRAAVITLFQDGPFVIQLDEIMCTKLEVGETYTFIVEEQNAALTEALLWDDGNVSSDALVLRCFSVTDFRTPNEEEYGLACWRVHYTT